MSVASVVTRGYIKGIHFIPPRGYLAGSGPAPTPTITGGHFLPANHKGKRSLSNVLTIYNKAKTLSRKETKELRDAISEFVPPIVAAQTSVPDIAKVNYEAIAANDAAYDRFSQAIANIQMRIQEMEQIEHANKLKLQQEDDELLLLTFISCIIN